MEGAKARFLKMNERGGRGGRRYGSQIKTDFDPEQDSMRMTAGHATQREKFMSHQLVLGQGTDQQRALYS
jgi:hypothetical protein